jgi:hypothetical protein
MIALLFFFLDFVAFSFWNGWFLNSLLVYFVVHSLKQDHFEVSFKFCYFPLILLLLQDCFLNGRFGLALIFFVPVIVLMVYLREVIDANQEYICYLLVICVLLFEHLFVKKMLLNKPFFNTDFLFEIFINIIITKVILLGVRGNRFLPVFKRSRF